MSQFVHSWQASSLQETTSHPKKSCLHCNYGYEAMAAFLLKSGKHESGAWVAIQSVSFSQQLARVSSEGASLRHFGF